MDTHFAVTVIAEYYKMSELKRQAVEKFRELKARRPLISVKEIITLATLAYTESHHDHGWMRQEILDLAYNRREELLESDVLSKNMEDESSMIKFSIDLMKVMSARHERQLTRERTLEEDRRQSSRRQKEEMQRKYEEYKQTTYSELERTKQKLASSERVVNQLIELNDIEQCRHCGANFYYNLMRAGPNGYRAKCVYCRTKHDRGMI